MLFWGKEYFLVNCLAKRKEFKKCEANKFAVIRQAFGSWAVCSLFLWYYVTQKDWSLKTELKLTSELCLCSPVLCVGDAEAWSIAAITTFLVCLLRSIALREVLTNRAVHVSCLCSFYDAVGLSGTSNALLFLFPYDSPCLFLFALRPVAVCWPPDAARDCWLLLLEMSKAVHNPAHPERQLCALDGYQWGHERNIWDTVYPRALWKCLDIDNTDWLMSCLSSKIIAVEDSSSSEGD